MKTPTLAILDQDGNKLPLSLPQGAEVEVPTGPVNENQIIDVVWEGKALMMFAWDLRDRGELVNGDGP